MSPAPKLFRRALTGLLSCVGTASAAAGANLLDQADILSLAAQPDAKLITLCAEFEALEREYRATDFEAEMDTPEGEIAAAELRRIEDAQAEIAERLCGMSITTLDGARALAGALAFYDGELFPNAAPGECTNELLLGALVGGLIGWPDSTRAA